MVEKRAVSERFSKEKERETKIRKILKREREDFWDFCACFVGRRVGGGGLFTEGVRCQHLT